MKREAVNPDHQDRHIEFQSTFNMHVDSNICVYIYVYVYASAIKNVSVDVCTLLLDVVWLVLAEGLASILLPPLVLQVHGSFIWCQMLCKHIYIYMCYMMGRQRLE